MIPKFRDLETKKEAWSELAGSVFWWTEGNGSCDCNRAPAFGLKDKKGVCLGHNRFVAVDITGYLEGYTKEEILHWMNIEYPPL